MTKKHYIEIARALNKSLVEAREIGTKARMLMCDHIDRIAEIMEEDNERFDKDKFINACITGKGI